jgi:hypothetical protein
MEFTSFSFIEQRSLTAPCYIKKPKHGKRNIKKQPGAVSSGLSNGFLI